MSEVREDAVEKAKRLGLKLVLPEPDEVFVDLDSDAELTVFQGRLGLLQQLYPSASATYTRSVNNHHHAYVTIPELAPIGDHERIAIQAALGSDPFREMLAIYHGRAGYKYTSCFFEVPERHEAMMQTELELALKGGAK